MKAGVTLVMQVTQEFIIFSFVTLFAVTASFLLFIKHSSIVVLLLYLGVPSDWMYVILTLIM